MPPPGGPRRLVLELPALACRRAALARGRGDLGARLAAPARAHARRGRPRVERSPGGRPRDRARHRGDAAAHARPFALSSPRARSSGPGARTRRTGRSASSCAASATRGSDEPLARDRRGAVRRHLRGAARDRAARRLRARREHVLRRGRGLRALVPAAARAARVRAPRRDDRLRVRRVRAQLRAPGAAEVGLRALRGAVRGHPGLDAPGDRGPAPRARARRADPGAPVRVRAKARLARGRPVRRVLVLPRPAPVLPRPPRLLRSPDRRDVAARRLRVPPRPERSRLVAVDRRLLRPRARDEAQRVLPPRGARAVRARPRVPALAPRARGAPDGARLRRSPPRGRAALRPARRDRGPGGVRRALRAAQPSDLALGAAARGLGLAARRAPADERAGLPGARAAHRDRVLRAGALLPALAVALAPPGRAHRRVPRVPRAAQPLRLVLPGHDAPRAAVPAPVRGREDRAHRAARAARADGVRAARARRQVRRRSGPGGPRSPSCSSGRTRSSRSR